jgi:hypothetical protein
MPPSHISLKYARIHDFRIWYLPANQSLFSKWYFAIQTCHLLSNSSIVSEPYTHELIIFLNSSSFRRLASIFSGGFFIMCHMHNLCTVLGRTLAMPALMLASSSVTMNAGAFPLIARRKVWNNQT